MTRMVGGLRSNLVCRGIFEYFYVSSKANFYSKTATSPLMHKGACLFLSIFLVGLRPRPLGRKERPAIIRASDYCFIACGLGRRYKPLPNLWLHPNGMFPYCSVTFKTYLFYRNFLGIICGSIESFLLLFEAFTSLINS